MKNSITYVLSLGVLFFTACSNKDSQMFTITGTIENNPVRQTIYLDKIEQGESSPTNLDTALLEAGTSAFTLQTVPAAEEGLYRLRLERDEVYFLIVGDRRDMEFNADLKQANSYTTNSAASNSFHHLMTLFNDRLSHIDSSRKQLDMESITRMEQDSLFNVHTAAFNTYIEETERILIQYADTTRSPVVALYLVGQILGSDFDPKRVENLITGLSKRFRDHSQIQKAVQNYFALLQKEQKPIRPGMPAPDFSLSDPNGKIVSLSSLRGKYVLVDFWASWCGPCRMENPNVVSAYQAFKSKNFTILGVSLDKEREPWLAAIAEDNLTWQHVSDLQFWNSSVVPLYGIEGIPYNVLIDPQGKIIAENLRGPALRSKLAEVLGQ